MAINLSGLSPLPRIKTWVQDTVDKKIGDYGKLTDIHLDVKQRIVNLEFLMHGEDSVIKVQLSDFKLLQVQGLDYLQIGLIQTSRQWMTLLGQDYLAGKFGTPNILINKNIAFILNIII
ncbi:MAG: hypothetical protein K9N06_12860 [Candidatus Cloacimonetes bacterium]|nr:hypothetical protein [Candidatus Cloacimonadota bacterium]